MALKLVKDSDAANYAVDADARVAAVLDWLAMPVSGDQMRELAPLRSHLNTLAELEIGSNQFHRILDLFQTRAHKVTQELKPRFREARIPLSKSLRRLAQDLTAVHGAVAASYQRILERMEPGAVVGRRHNPMVVASRALKSLSDQFQVAALAGSSPPEGLWAEAHRMYREARREGSGHETVVDQPLDSERTYREMLALAAAQLERLSPPEVLAAADYVSRFAAAVEITTKPPAEPDYRKFWFDPAADMPPIAVARKLPPPDGGICYFSCARLGVLAAEQVRELEAGTPPDHLHLPAEANEPAYRGLLQRLHDGWADPPARHLVRRRHSYQVDVCIGFDVVQRLFDDAADADATPFCVAPSTWIVLNESPAGFAALHVSGDVAGLSAGGVVALRAHPGKPWDVCVVRWIRMDNPDHVEVGLQVLASDARVVGIAFRNTRTPQGVVRGLLLPAVPAVRAHEAVLVPAGTCQSRRFLMLIEEGRTHVVQGRLVNVDVQTVAVELFEFNPDPYPI